MGAERTFMCDAARRPLLVGTDGNPDVVHDHESADGSHSGDQASDGLVGHDVTLGVRLGERRQGALILEPSTRPRYRVSGLAKGSFQSPLAGRVGLPDEFGEVHRARQHVH